MHPSANKKLYEGGESASTWQVTVARVARIAFPLGVEKRVLAMFVAYLDESGTHRQSPVVAVAGYVAPEKQWSLFDAAWKKILRETELPFFHMTDWENRHGEFKGWDNETRIALFARLAKLIERRITTRVISAVGVQDYRDAKLWQHSPDIPKNPYAFCAFMCLRSIAQWADTAKHHEPIAYVFENGAEHKGELTKLHQLIIRSEAQKKRYRLFSLTYVDKKDFSPLQAADMLAYEAYKEARRRFIEGEKRPPRTSFKVLLGRALPNEHIYCQYFGRERLLSPTLYRKWS